MQTIQILVLTVLSLLSILPLIILIEYVALHLLRWGKFRQCLNASVRMNALTFVVGIGFILAYPKPDEIQLLVFWAIATGLETVILMVLRKSKTRANLAAAIVANAVSYVVLILPAFRFQ
jgi:hypothetical protein